MSARLSGWLRWLAGMPARLVTEHAMRVWIVLASLVTILGFPFAVWQLHDLQAQQTARTLRGLSLVDQQLNTETNRAIRHRILRGDVLLKPTGPFTPEDLGDYLDALESLADWWGQKQIDTESIDIWFGDLIRRTSRNVEVRTYIRAEQAEDPDFYSGFEDLAKAMPRRPESPTIRAASPSAPSREAAKDMDRILTSKEILLSLFGIVLGGALSWFVTWVYDRRSQKNNLAQREKDRARWAVASMNELFPIKDSTDFDSRVKQYLEAMRRTKDDARGVPVYRTDGSIGVEWSVSLGEYLRASDR